MIRNDRYPHVFQPLTVRGLTLKNRLEYAPTVVLKCSPEGEVTQEMLDYVAWQAKTGVGYLTIGNTPVVHTDSSAWVCELNVTQDRCIHGLEMMARTARENGAEIHLDTEVTPELVEQVNPDAVIVASGSTYVHPNIPGIEMDKVKTVSDVENHRVPVGENVVVCGGGIVGLECAVMLGMEGKKVTVIDQIPLEKFADGMPVFNHIELNYQLEKYGVTLVGGQKITSFGENGVETVDASGEKQTFAGDTYVLALGVKPDNRLAQQLLSAYAEGVYVVGDCVSTGRLLADANQEAFHAAIRIR